MNRDFRADHPLISAADPPSRQIFDRLISPGPRARAREYQEKYWVQLVPVLTRIVVLKQECKESWLAAHLGVNRSTINRWVNEQKDRIPSAALVHVPKLIGLLGLDVTRVFDSQVRQFVTSNLAMDALKERAREQRIQVRDLNLIDFRARKYASSFALHPLVWSDVAHWEEWKEKNHTVACQLLESVGNLHDRDHVWKPWLLLAAIADYRLADTYFPDPERASEARQKLANEEFLQQMLDQCRGLREDESDLRPEMTP